MVILNCTVEVEPDAGVGALVLMSCVVAATFVLDAPRQQTFTAKVLPFEDPHAVEPSPLKTADISAVFEAFTEKPNCAFAGLVSKPAG